MKQKRRGREGAVGESHKKKVGGGGGGGEKKKKGGGGGGGKRKKKMGYAAFALRYTARWKSIRMVIKE